MCVFIITILCENINLVIIVPSVLVDSNLFLVCNPDTNSVTLYYLTILQIEKFILRETKMCHLES